MKNSLIPSEEKAVFKDIDSIPAGTDFREKLRQSLAQCKVLIVVIGKHWLLPSDLDKPPRLFNAGDYVRLEIEEALSRGIPVLPVLVNSGRLPQQQELPPSLKQLPSRQTSVVRHDPDFFTDMQRLVRSIEYLGVRKSRKHHVPLLAAIAAVLLATLLATLAVGVAVPIWLYERRVGRQEKSARELVDLVKANVAPDDWSESKGPFTIKESRGALSVLATDNVHLRIQDLLEQLRAKRGLPPKEGKKAGTPAQEKLYAVLQAESSLEYIETPLHEVAGDIGERFEITILLDEDAFDQASISRESLITINTRNSPLHASLELMLSKLGLTYMTTELGLMITTVEKERTVVSSRVFDVRDLISY